MRLFGKTSLFLCCLRILHSNPYTYILLRELAELLGQVKPPVATKEEIEKSGLETIKASEMRQHELSGKITSNCMDRVRLTLSFKLTLDN